MKKPIGRIIATEKVPTTMDKFTFWTDSDLKLHLRQKGAKKTRNS